MYQIYLTFLRDIDVELKKTLESSTQVVNDHILQRTCKQQDLEFVTKKLEDFKFQVDKYGIQAIEKFRENLKANIEGPIQAQTHFIAMKNQRQKSKSYKVDDLERVIDNRIQEASEKQKQQLIHYLDTFEEEFKFQNQEMANEYQQIEKELEELELKD
ncbi:unnamed protein product [Paramecium octaurelia]|uniref:Uncharacterized protein n=1 Tax=Paramecium octaurelia TaxID=43137 RepID=A0A8S1UMD5_PAROT|nr:unnamed protein product [Paramecium octaurelia]